MYVLLLGMYNISKPKQSVFSNFLAFLFYFLNHWIYYNLQVLVSWLAKYLFTFPNEGVELAQDLVLIINPKDASDLLFWMFKDPNSTRVSFVSSFLKWELRTWEEKKWTKIFCHVIFRFIVVKKYGYLQYCKKNSLDNIFSGMII